MVEIHGYGILSDFLDLPLDHLSFGIEHRDDATGHEQVPADFAVDLECAERQIHPVALVVLSVSFFRSQGEAEAVAGLLPFEIRLEFGQQHACAVNVFERLVRPGFVGDLSFDLQFVAYRHDLVLFNFHILAVTLFQSREDSD